MGSIDSLVLYLQTRTWFPTAGGVTLPGVTQLIYFLIIVIVMVWLGGRIPERGTLLERAAPSRTGCAQAGDSCPRPCGLDRGHAFMTFPYDFRQALINSLIGAIVCLSLVVITGFVGQISLVQLALAGVGGYAVSKFAADAGIAFPIGPIIGAAVATLVRLGGRHLGTACARREPRDRHPRGCCRSRKLRLQQHVVGRRRQRLSDEVALALRSPIWGRTPFTRGPTRSCQARSSGSSASVVVIVLGLFVASLRTSRLGQQMLAVRSNERAAASAGISVRNVKLAAFGISSFIAGLAGAMYAYDFGSVSSAPQYGIISALGFVAFAYLGGITTVTGALFGGLIATDGLGIHAIESWTGLPSDWELLFGGVALLVTVVASPDGIAGRDQARHSPPVRLDSLLRSAALLCEVRPSIADEDTMTSVLRVEGLSVDYGGVHALIDVALWKSARVSSSG